MASSQSATPAMNATKLPYPKETDAKYALPGGRFNTSLFDADVRAVEEHNEKVYIESAERPVPPTPVVAREAPTALLRKSSELKAAMAAARTLVKSDAHLRWEQTCEGIDSMLRDVDTKLEVIQTKLEHKAATHKGSEKQKSKLTWATHQAQTSENKIAKSKAEMEALKTKAKRQTEECEASLKVLDDKLEADIEALKARHRVETQKVHDKIASKKAKLKAHLEELEAAIARSTANIKAMKAEMETITSEMTFIPDKADYVQLASLKKSLVRFQTNNKTYYQMFASADERMRNALCTYLDREFHKIGIEDKENVPWLHESELCKDYEHRFEVFDARLADKLKAVEELMGGASYSMTSSDAGSTGSAVITNEVIFEHDSSDSDDE